METIEPLGNLIHALGGLHPEAAKRVQGRVIELQDDVASIDHAKPSVNELSAHMVRADADFGAARFIAKPPDKIRAAGPI